MIQLSKPSDKVTPSPLPLKPRSAPSPAIVKQSSAQRVKSIPPVGKPKAVRPTKQLGNLPKEKIQTTDRAKRNADAYTAFVVVSAVSAAVFLGCGIGTAHSGVRYGKAEGMARLLDLASDGSEEFFTTSGELNRDAEGLAKHIPGLHATLRRIEKRSEQDHVSVGSTIDQMKSEAQADSRHFLDLTRGTGIAAAAGLVGMLIFIPAASITRHRGLMLFQRNGRAKARASLLPEFSSRKIGLGFQLRW